MRLALAAVTALAVACSGAAPTVAADPSGPRLDRLPTGDQVADQAALDSARRAIRALAGAGKCADGQCASLAVGVKPCGGPWEYVTYCPTGPEADRLRALAADVARANRAFNERYGVGSTCDVAVPAAGCPVSP